MDTFDQRGQYGSTDVERLGRIEVIPSKPCSSQRDLALAYTPGVAEPCAAIRDNPPDVYRYTSKGRLIAAITNGTAIPGLGNIGPHAAKPYMEALSAVYKTVADIDLFDIELSTTDDKELLEAITSLEPTFGGVLVVGIKAPNCYTLLSKLKQRLSIPVMLESAGVAIAVCAAILNGSKIKTKPINDMRFICVGKSDLKKAVLQQLFSLGIDPGLLFSSKNATVGYGFHAIAYSDVLVIFNGQSEDVLAALKQMLSDPLLVLLDKSLISDIPSFYSARPDTIVVPLDPLLKNGLDAALSCPHILRSALDNRRTRISTDSLKAEAISLANRVGIQSIVKDRKVLPEIMDHKPVQMPKPFGHNVIL